MAKAMKSMKAMKVMKAMKPKEVSKNAMGKMMRAVVFGGRKEKTKTGLTKAMLTNSKSGKTVSKKGSAQGTTMLVKAAANTKVILFSVLCVNALQI